MIDEEQIIKDIVDRVYGFNIPAEENNSKKIKLNEEERQKKCDDVLDQINSLCKKVEKELEKNIDTKTPEMSTFIRLTVFTSIRAEISNGNEIFDANGKIDTGKFLDIVIQSKNEILEKANSVANKNQADHSRDSELEEEPKTNENIDSKGDRDEGALEDFFDALADFDIDFTDDDKEVMRRAKRAVKEYEKKVQEKIDSGMSEEEAMKAVYNSMTIIERMELDLQYSLVKMQEGFTESQKGYVDEEKENTASKTEATSESRESQEKAASPGTTSATISEQVDARTKKIHGGLAEKYHEIHMGDFDISYNQRTESMDLLGQASDLTDLQGTQSVFLKLGINDDFLAKTNINEGDRHIFDDQIAILKRTFEVMMTPGPTKHTGRIVDTKDHYKAMKDTPTQYASIENQRMPYVTVVSNDLLRDEEMNSFVEAKKVPLDSPTHEDVMRIYSNLRRTNYATITGLEAYGNDTEIVESSTAPQKTVSTVIPGETAVEEPITPPTEDPAKKLVDVFHPVTPKVQSSPIVAEDVVVGTFEPKTPTPTAEPTVKSTKGNDDASGKGEGNIPLSGLKTFLREVATVRDAAEAAEKLHVNGEKGASKDGTNTQPSTTQTVEESKTEEVPEEPQ